MGSHDGIAVAYLMSSERRSWKVDGRIAAVGGLIDTMLSDIGVIWLAISEADAARYPVAMFKTAREWLRIFGQGKRELRITILLDDPASVRFAKRLGFEMTGEQTDDGKLAVMRRKCEGE